MCAPDLKGGGSAWEDVHIPESDLVRRPLLAQVLSSEG